MIVFGANSAQDDESYSAYGGTPAYDASTGALGLNNSGDSIIVADSAGTEMINMSYGSEAGDNQSVSRNALATGDFVKHSNLNDGALFSPGTQNGEAFAGAIAQNTAPTATDSTVTVAEDGNVAITPVVADAETDSNSLVYDVTIQPTQGTLDTTQVPWNYAPAPNYNGSDSVSFTVTDGELNSEVATITITVTNENDAPVISGTAATTVALDGEYSFLPVASDVDGDSLTFSVSGAPSWLAIDAATGALTGTASSLEDASSVVVSVTDGTDSVSLPAFAISVVQTNVAPVANAANLTTDEDTATTFTPSGSDSNGDTISFILVTAPSNGTVNDASGVWTYTPSADFNGTDSFSFKANDGELDSAVVAVSVTVTAINDAPEGTAQTVTTEEDTDLVIDLTTVFTDIDGDLLTYAIDAQAENGSVTLDGSTLTYQANPDFNGSNTLVSLLLMLNSAVTA